MITSRQEWRTALQGLGDEGTGLDLEALAEAMRKGVEAPGQALGDCLDAGPGLGHAARVTLMELGPAAIEGLLRTEDYEAPDDRAWFLDRLLEAELQTRARVRARLLRALDDKAWLKDAQGGPLMESYPPRRRVCDQAYLAMRALTHPEEDQVGFGVESEQFLHMPVEIKDRVIEHARTAHQWNMSPPEPDSE
jgi:hypothetical protein